MTQYKEPPPGEMLRHLPAIYSEADGSNGQFLRDFLDAFGKILIGRADTHDIPEGANSLHSLHGKNAPMSSLEATIANIADLFDPLKTWDEFLPWLASWAAFSLRADLPEQSKRDFISEIFRLYSWRGTKQNLEKLLTIFTIGAPTVTEDEKQAHYFRVTLSLLEEGGEQILDPQQIQRQIAIAYGLIDLEKPAHTDYELRAEHISMQIGDPSTKKGRSTIGKDTLLGTVR
jgi:phage tail-like protein